MRILTKEELALAIGRQRMLHFFFGFFIIALIVFAAFAYEKVPEDLYFIIVMGGMVLTWFGSALTMTATFRLSARKDPIPWVGGIFICFIISMLPFIGIIAIFASMPRLRNIDKMFVLQTQSRYQAPAQHLAQPPPVNTP